MSVSALLTQHSDLNNNTPEINSSHHATRNNHTKRELPQKNMNTSENKVPTDHSVAALLKRNSESSIKPLHEPFSNSSDVLEKGLEDRKVSLNEDFQSLANSLANQSSNNSNNFFQSSKNKTECFELEDESDSNRSDNALMNISEKQVSLMFKLLRINLYFKILSQKEP